MRESMSKRLRHLPTACLPMLRDVLSWFEAHQGKAGSLTGWYQQGASVGIAVLLIPFVIDLLPASHAGLWFSFQGILQVITLTNFGLLYTISRQVAYTNATKETREDPDDGDFIPLRTGVAGVADLYSISRTLYLGLLGVGTLLVIVIGECILPLGRLLPDERSEAATAWYLLSTASLLLLLADRYRGFLIGLGRLYAVNLVYGTFFFVSGIAVFTGLILTHSLLVMAFCQLCCSFIPLLGFRLWLVRFLPNKVGPATPSAQRWRLLAQLLRIAAPFGLMHTGTFLVHAIQVPLIGFFMGAEAVSPYYIAQKMGFSIKTAVRQLTNPQYPLFTSDIAAQRYGPARQRFLRTVIFGTGAGLIGMCAFVLASPWIVEIWIGPETYVGGEVLSWMAINYFLSLSTHLWGMLTIAHGRNPFVLSTLLQGIINISLCVLLIPKFGILGIVWSHFFAGLVTNYGYHLLRGLRVFRAISVRTSES